MKFLLRSLCLFFCSSVGLAAVTRSHHEMHPFDREGYIDLNSLDGNIEISAWDKNVVSIDSEKSASSDAELDRIRLNIDVSAAKLSISSENPQGAQESQSPSVNFRLHVPVGVQLAHIRGIHSNITVTGVRGRISCETVNGSIKVSGAANDTSLSCVNGGIYAEFDRLENASHVEMRTINGECELRLASPANVTIEAHASNGEVVCNLPGAATLSSHDLKATLGSGTACVILFTENGSVKVSQLPDGRQQAMLYRHRFCSLGRREKVSRAVAKC